MKGAGAGVAFGLPYVLNGWPGCEKVVWVGGGEAGPERSEFMPKLVTPGGGEAGPGRRALTPNVVTVGGGEAGPGIRPCALGLYVCWPYWLLVDM